MYKIGTNLQLKRLIQSSYFNFYKFSLNYFLNTDRFIAYVYSTRQDT